MRLMGRPAKKEAPAYGKHLASLRTVAGLSQQQVADEIGVRQSTIATWERSSRPPKGDVLSQLAKLFNVSIQDLLGAEPTRTQKPTHRGPASRLERLISEAGKLPRRRQQRIADTLELLIEREAQAS